MSLQQWWGKRRQWYQGEKEPRKGAIDFSHGRERLCRNDIGVATVSTLYGAFNLLSYISLFILSLHALFLPWGKLVPHPKPLSF
jgi:hypothetical protein